MNMSSPNVVVQSKYGPIIINVFDQYIGKSILRTGSWDEGSITLLKQLVEMKLKSKSPVLFYDVGANIGTHSLPLAKLFGSSIKIRAFEAQPMIYNMLCGTLALNNLQNVAVHLSAVSERSGTEISFEPPDYEQENNFGGLELVQPYQSDNHYMRKSSDKISIQTVCIDAFSEDVDIVKMDIEGMEIQALRGAERTIVKSRPIVLLETRKSKFVEIEQYFLQKDYKLYRNDEDMFAIPRESQIDIPWQQ